MLPEVSIDSQRASRQTGSTILLPSLSISEIILAVCPVLQKTALPLVTTEILVF